MVFQFHTGSNTTVATTNIKCQRWFSKFKSSNFDLSESYRSGRSTLDNDMLSPEVEAKPCQTTEELSNTLNQTRSTIQEPSQQIGRVSRTGVWVPHNLSEENTPRVTYCFSGTI